MIDLTVTLSRPANSIEELLAPMREAAASRLDGVLCVIDQELVSSDFLGFRQSTIIDAPATIMLSPTVFKASLPFRGLAWVEGEEGVCALTVPTG